MTLDDLTPILLWCAIAGPVLLLFWWLRGK
jgi:hypothetical protein